MVLISLAQRGRRFRVVYTTLNGCNRALCLFDERAGTFVQIEPGTKLEVIEIGQGFRGLPWRNDPTLGKILEVGANNDDGPELRDPQTGNNIIPWLAGAILEVV